MKITGKPQEIIEKLSKLKEDKVYICEVLDSESKVYRSRQQVNYYWGVIVKLVSEHTGNTPIEVNWNNKILFKKETFTDVSPGLFEQYMKLIREYYKTILSVEGVEFIIPLPNENLYDN